MSSPVAGTALDEEKTARLYDVESYVSKLHGGVLVEDPYEQFAELRSRGAVLEGSTAALLGVPQGPSARPDLPHWSAYTFAACDQALRDNETFSSTVYAGQTTRIFGKTILEMVGAEHRKYRALVTPAFVPGRRTWWIDRFITTLVDAALTSIEKGRRAELNAQLCARIPLHTITNSFGLTNEQAWRFREVYGDPQAPGNEEAIADIASMLATVIEARRSDPRDDIITMLVRSEYAEDGHTQRLTNDEISGFARLILTAGSGTTWRQLGILLTALLRDPDQLEALRADRGLLPQAIDEAVRWEATDPIFRRLVTKDVTLDGVDIPAGVVLEMNLGAANHDPSRWEAPERFDLFRERKPHVGFAGGPHSCLGRHVAAAEMTVAMNAVLDRLPDVRWDPEVAQARIVGLEHRGPTEIHVVFGEG